MINFLFFLEFVMYVCILQVLQAKTKCLQSTFSTTKETKTWIPNKKENTKNKCDTGNIGKLITLDFNLFIVWSLNLCILYL